MKRTHAVAAICFFAGVVLAIICLVSANNAERNESKGKHVLRVVLGLLALMCFAACYFAFYDFHETPREMRREERQDQSVVYYALEPEEENAVRLPLLDGYEIPREMEREERHDQSVVYYALEPEEENAVRLPLLDGYEIPREMEREERQDQTVVYYALEPEEENAVLIRDSRRRDPVQTRRPFTRFGEMFM